MHKQAIYPGIDQDSFGGMTDIGRIIRDAWVFQLIPETETCAGWNNHRLEQLYAQVHEAWRPYGHLVSQLPLELRQRHERIYNQAIEKAKALGWSAELYEDD